MEVLSKTQKIIYSLATLGVIVLFALIINMPVNKASAGGQCDTVGTPSIRVDINGQTYWEDASFSVPAGTVLPFTVWTYSEPSSPNRISYPGGASMYPGPCGNLGCPGRHYTTVPINSPASIVVWDQQNCSGPGAPEYSITITINVDSATCTINTFTCDGNATLAWGTSNCSSVSISPSVGVVSATGNTQGTVGASYTLTADSKTSVKNCPAPALNSVWQENGSPTISKTVTPGKQIAVPLNFSNTGASGSVIKNTQCSKGVISGIDPSLVDKTCDNITITAP